ncbi:MAG: LytR C-terminal domain-containing protein, partial [Actinomycetota bacterium]|nr:LytR C-terminal domain-containing protein [Actinomycetota bacterium]
SVATGGPGGPPANAGARGALLLAVAVVLGIVLLQQFDSGIDTGGQVSTNTTVSADDLTTTTRRIGLTTVPPVTTTVARARAKSDVKVLVANGSGVRGLAGNTTNALKGLGYATLSPVDATTNVDKTTVQYADGYEAEARELAASVSLPATVLARLSSPPVAAADLGDAKVIVILGADAPTLGSTSSTAAGAASSTSTTRR